MQDSRIKGILKASIIGIIINIALGIFKAIVGLITHSVAITMDAVNNFSDAGSSFITILAAHFSSKEADKKHPFGYGRTEYLGTLLIAGIILYAGITALIESIKSIINPEIPEYSLVSIIIVSIAVLVKIGLSIYVTSVGKKINSDSLVASGKEAMFDVLISTGTVIAALLFVLFNISIEAWLGVLIAIVIIKAGVETLMETIDKILGSPAEVSLVKDVKAAVKAHNHVEGAYDLILHNYGPDSYLASIHIAVEDTLTINELDDLIREIQSDIKEQFGIHLTAVGIYSVNTKNEYVVKMRDEVSKVVLEQEYVNQMHGFYLNEEKKEMRFDVVISFGTNKRREAYENVLNVLNEKYPEYTFKVGMDADFNELD